MSATRIPVSLSRTVLLVEDEPRLRDMLSHAVSDMGFSVVTAGSAEIGLRRLTEHKIDIVVLDLNLPGMGGLGFLKQSRQQQPDLAVIILTGFGDLEAARTAIRYNVVDFLSKPCPLGDLEASLERARQRRAAAAGLPTGPATAAVPNNPGTSPEQSLEEIERLHILAALDRNHGNRQAAAEALGISVRKLYYRLDQYQKEGYLQPESKPESKPDKQPPPAGG